MTSGQFPRWERQYWCERDFGGTSSSREVTQERIVAVATNARQTGRVGAFWTRQKTGAENIHTGVEVESAPIARVGSPTA